MEGISILVADSIRGDLEKIVICKVSIWFMLELLQTCVTYNVLN